jgi:hypothetical protein
MKLEYKTNVIVIINSINKILLFRFIDKYIINVVLKWIEENF